MDGVVAELGTVVAEGAGVTVDGRTVRPRRSFRYFAYHKPRGVITTTRDPEGRRTVRDALPPPLRDLKPVGRLDIATEGLLLLTDDGDFAQRVAHPSFRVAKRYRVEFHGVFPAENAAALEKGIRLEDGHVGRVTVERVTRRGDVVAVTVKALYGRKRMIRLMFAALGFRDIFLRRVAVGPVALGALKPGQFRPLTRREVESLRGESRR